MLDFKGVRWFFYPRSLTARTWKMMVGRLLSYWGWLIFKGYVKLPGRVDVYCITNQPICFSFHLVLVKWCNCQAQQCLSVITYHCDTRVVLSNSVAETSGKGIQIHWCWRILLMEEILHHLWCIRPCKYYDVFCRISSIMTNEGCVSNVQRAGGRIHIGTGRTFFSSTILALARRWSKQSQWTVNMYHWTVELSWCALYIPIQPIHQDFEAAICVAIFWVSSSCGITERCTETTMCSGARLRIWKTRWTLMLVVELPTGRSLLKR